MKCETCKMKRVCNELERMGKVSKHENCRCYSPEKPVTNADRFRAMSDEGLTELFADNDCGHCRIHDFCFAKGCQINCEDVWLDWLRQEVTDG